MTKHRGVDNEKRLKSIVASMKFEGLEPTKKDIENCRKILNGEITADESISEIINHYKKGGS